MSFSTLMVHLDLFHSNDARLRIAGDLTELFNAKLIGIAACDPQPSNYASGAFAQGLVDEERADLKQRMAETEERFRSHMQRYATDVEWRSSITERPGDYVPRQARAADLIITGANHNGALADPRLFLDTGDLVMRAGRPIFIVPPEVEYLPLKSALVAWKDTREARQAIVSALPLLQKAKDVEVIEVIRNHEHRHRAQTAVDDVVRWLDRQGVVAFGRVLHAVEEEHEIDRVWQQGADFVVAGAYGHTRLREWVFGGFTRSLLTNCRRCSFLMH
jgi:nucleotide-binding universal stress UspA family protein